MSTDILNTEWVTVDTGDGAMRAYLARPHRTTANGAAVLVLHEAFGINDHIRDVVRRFATAGYIALAPDLFHRSGVGEIPYDDRDRAMAEIDSLGPDAIISDVSAAVGFLDASQLTPVERTTLVGFCFGGRAAFTAATGLPGLAGTVSFYGPGVVAGPHAVLDRLAKVSGPMLFLVGADDPTIPPEHVAALRSAASDSGVDLDIEVFEGAGHAFHCDARPAVYVPDAAERAWHLTLTFIGDVTAATGQKSVRAGQGADSNPQLAGVPLLELPDIEPALADRLRPRVQRLGYLGDFFKLAAHQPQALAAFMDFTESSRSALPDWAGELVALTVATYSRNDYERVQHERLAVRLGLAREWINAVEELAPDDQGELAADHRAVQNWVLAALGNNGHGSLRELEEMVQSVGAEHAVAVALLCGRYVAHALFVNSFGVLPPVESVFASTHTARHDEPGA